MRVKVLAILSALFLLPYSFAETCQEVLTVFCDLDRVPDYNYSTLLIDNIDANGKVEHMEVKQYGGGSNGLKNTVFDFQSPATVKSTRVLQAEKVGKQDERWIYIPSLRQARRIPMSERYKSFVGTEATYNDMTIREPEEDESEMLSQSETISVGGAEYTCWKMKQTPIKKSEVEYGHRVSWYDKKSYIPVRIEYYDKKNETKMIKIYECEKVEWVKGVTGIEYPLRRSNLISNLVTGRKTRIMVKDFKFDDPISDSYFTQPWLISGKAK